VGAGVGDAASTFVSALANLMPLPLLPRNSTSTSSTRHRTSRKSPSPPP
jgi:hypothetical protein